MQKKKSKRPSGIPKNPIATPLETKMQNSAVFGNPRLWRHSQDQGESCWIAWYTQCTRESRISWNCPSFKLLKFVTKDAAALCSNSLFPFMSPAIWMAKRPRQSKEVDTFCACQAEQLSACANQRTLPETLRARLLCEQNGLRHGICKTVGHFQFIFVMITTAQNKLWKSAFAWRRSKHSLRGYDTVCRVHCKCACITTQR